MSKLETKIDKIVEDISEIKLDVAKNTISLDEHIRRTNAVEELIQLHQNDVKELKVTIDEDVSMLKKHVAFVKGAIWTLGMAAAIIMGLNELGILSKLFS